jgi:hypothetical protein
MVLIQKERTRKKSIGKVTTVPKDVGYKKIIVHMYLGEII